MNPSRKAVYSPLYEVDIGPHVFPTAKYRLVKEKLVNSGLYGEKDFVDPQPASLEDLLKVHTREYIGKIKDGTLSHTDEIRLELPYSEELARASLLCAGGTLKACTLALEQDFCAHLGGGFHHAYPDHGEGFCVFNDAALGAAAMNEKGMKVLIVDCDLHQGNGTAVVFKDNSDVFTFSIHQENNYPLYKEKSDMDIGLPDGTSGSEYNLSLERSIREIEKRFSPDFIVYIAGADPYEKDQLGGFNLSIEDLKERDRIVKDFAGRRKVPVSVVFAGGYALRLDETAEIHFNTVKVFSCS